MLLVEGLQSSYGASRVLFDVHLEAKAGEITTLIGRNGMGKTTTIRAILGLLPRQGGRVVLDGKIMTHAQPETVARAGIGLVPEGRQVFPTLNVRENLIATAANRRAVPSPWTLERVFAMFPRLEERQEQSAKTLSGGEQQMLAIGRALMTNPRLLILDEATEGLAPTIRGDIWACLKTLNGEGLAILLIDKNLSVLKRIAHRHHVLEKGRTIWSGAAEDVAQQPDVLERSIAL